MGAGKSSVGRALERRTGLARLDIDETVAAQFGMPIAEIFETYGEEKFRDGIRHYMAAHQYSNSTTADLWNTLSEASDQPVGAIAAGWTEPRAARTSGTGTPAVR